MVETILVLHLSEAFAAGEAKGRGGAQAPCFHSSSFMSFFKLGTCPLAEVALQQTLLEIRSAHIQAFLLAMGAAVSRARSSGEA